MLNLLAFDYGASSGRAILGRYSGKTLALKEVHRFPNEPVMVNGSFYWDILRLFHEMKQGILKCMAGYPEGIAGIGIDTWGVDFGLLGPSGELLGNPFHYRDNRTDGTIEEACKIIPKQEIYRQTGIQFIKFNTLFQLLSMKMSNSPLLENASAMLMMPDLLRYFLTGEKSGEYTISTTTQLYDPINGKWAKSLISKMGIPERIFTDIVPPGTITGRISRSVSEELNIADIPVIAVAEHDTASAVASVPAGEGRYAYISSGTWSLIGVESPHPVINDTTFSLNYTNEGGINNTIRLLKNIAGLWIYQECKRAWDRTGEIFSFDELEQLAEKSEPFAFFIDPDDDLFYSPGNMPDKVTDFCRRTGQGIPPDKAAIVRCIMESLALKYKITIKGLEEIVGYDIPIVHIVGGGSRNAMLCRFTADATCKTVITGPVEATAAGNLISQLIGLKEVSNLNEARMLIKRSFPVSEYHPVNTTAWQEAFARFSGILA